VYRKTLDLKIGRAKIPAEGYEPNLGIIFANRGFGWSNTVGIPVISFLIADKNTAWIFRFSVHNRADSKQ